MPGYRTALGIDISDSRINLVLLKKQGDSVKLLKAASCPVPDGAIKDGNVVEAMTLARAIKKLKTRNGIRVHPTAISLVANPTLMQILDLPKDAPGNVRQLVHNEVKHYAMLPLKKAAVDFCGIKSSTGSGKRRALVVATDGQKVVAVAKALNREGLNIEVIEPAWTAYTRACYTKKISGKSNTNILFATISNGVLTLSLFKDQILDFVRVKSVDPGLSQSKDYFEWLGEEIDEVLKFYKFGTTKKSDKWQVILNFCDSDKTVEEKTRLLKAKLKPAESEIRTRDNAYLDTPISDKTGDNIPSAVAIGLAMGLFNVSGHGLNINLLPSEIMIAKSREKHTLLIANIAAVVFAVTIVCIGFLQAKAEKVNADIRQQKQTQVSYDTQGLLKEQVVLEKQITELNSKLEQMNIVLGTNSALMWEPILNDIKIAAPKTVRITEIFSRENSDISLNGLALSYEAIYSFIEKLSTSKNIKSASLVGSQNHNQPDSLVEYSINCSLAQ